MGCGGGGGGTNTVVQNSQPPQWLQNNLQALYSQAQGVTSQPLQLYQGNTVAGFTPTQETAFNTINQLQGSQQPYYNAAAGLIMGASQPINFTPVSASDISQYQNPYTQQVVNATEAQMANTDAQQQQQLLGQAIQSGASPFGGDRVGVAAAALAGQQALANNQTIAGLYNQGYTTALGEANTQQQQQLAAQEASQYLGQQGAYGLTNLGTATLNSGLQGASAQLQAGGLGQQLAQEQLNVPYEQYLQTQAYPYQQLSALEQATGVAGGLAGGTSSTTSPGPSSGSQLAGLGIAGLSLAPQIGAGASYLGGLLGLKKGGKVPHYQEGGIMLPKPPDLSVSYVDTGNIQMPHSSIPSAPKAAAVDNSINSPNNTFGGLGGVGGIKNLVSMANSASPGASSDNPLGLSSGPRFTSSDLSKLNDAFNSPLDATSNPGFLSQAGDWLSSAFSFKEGGAVPHMAQGGGLGLLPDFLNGNLSWSDIGQTALHALPMALAALKTGGKVPRYQSGGLTPFLQSASPMQNNQTRQFSQMDTQQLRQLATRLPPNSPYSQIVQRVLQQKQAMPNAGLSPASGAPTVPSAPMGGLAAATPSMARGGLAHYDDGGDVPSAALLEADPTLAPYSPAPTNFPAINSPASPADVGKIVHLYSDNDTVHAPDLEEEKDPNMQVDHSGDTVQLKSNEGTLDLGIPSQKPAAKTSNDLGLQPWQQELLDVGLGIMGGKSPHALENIGQGALQGMKSYEGQQQQQLEQQKEKAAEAYQTGELGMRGRMADLEAQRLAQEGKYQQGELALRGKELTKPELVKDMMGQPIGWATPGSNKITSLAGLPDYMGNTGGGTGIPSSSPNAPISTGLNAPSVGTYLDNVLLNNPAPAKDIDAFLSKYPPQVITHAELIACGEEAFPTGFAAAKNPILMQAVSLAKQINPSITGASYQTFVDFNKGKSSDTIRALNTAIPHLDTLGKLATALDNNDTQSINKMSNFFKERFGKPAPTNFDTAKQIVADEVVKAVVGAGGSQFDREQAAATINKANSPEQLKQDIGTYEQLMAGQMSSLQQKYEAGTGRKDFQDKFLTQHTKGVLASYSAGSAASESGSAPAAKNWIIQNGQLVAAP